MLSKLMEYIPTALAIIGAASVMVKTIAPLTDTKFDDKLAGWISKAAALLGKVALNPKK